MNANGPAVGFSKRYPTPHPITIQLPVGRRARKLSRCKEGTAWFLPTGYKFYWALRVSGYKVDRSQKTITVQNFCCEHWRSVAVQTVSEAGIYHGAGFIKRASAGVRVQVLAGFVMGAGFCKNHDELINPTVRVMVRCFVNSNSRI